jgi:branched-chain amino acid transport system permease protein
VDASGATATAVQYLISGLTVGVIYALVALGYNIIYNVTEVINLAQGEFVMLGGLLAAFCLESLHLPLPLAFLAAVAAVAGLGYAMQRCAIQPARGRSVLTLIIITIAVSILLKGTAMLAWGKDPYSLPPFSAGRPWVLAGAVLQPQTLWVIGVSLAVVVLLTLFFKHTVYGQAMLACADNPRAARMVGIPVQRMVFIAFVLSAAIGAAGGVAITPISLMEYDRGTLLGIKGFGAAVLGGLGHFSGAALAGVLLGLAESLCAGYLSSGYKDAVALVLLLLVLFFKPEGLLGSREAARLKRF